MEGVATYAVLELYDVHIDRPIIGKLGAANTNKQTILPNGYQDGYERPRADNFDVRKIGPTVHDGREVEVIRNGPLLNAARYKLRPVAPLPCAEITAVEIASRKGPAKFETNVRAIPIGEKWSAREVKEELKRG